VERFSNPCVQKSIAVNLEIISAYDRILERLERDIIQTANEHDALSYNLLKTIPGVGRILALILLYEVENIGPVPKGPGLRLLRPPGKVRQGIQRKKYGTSGKKIGNVHLKWAFSEAAVLFLKGNEAGKRYLDRLSSKHGKGKALPYSPQIGASCLLHAQGQESFR